MKSTKLTCDEKCIAAWHDLRASFVGAYSHAGYADDPRALPGWILDGDKEGPRCARWSGGKMLSVHARKYEYARASTKTWSRSKKRKN